MPGTPRKRERRGQDPHPWRGDPARQPRSRPPFEPGNQVARKHGVWAADVRPEARDVVSGLYDPADVERYPAMAQLGAEIWVRWRRALADIAERGEVLADGSPHPLLRFVGQWERQLLDLSTRFGLDPRSDAALVRERAEASRSAADLDAITRRGREVLEAREVP